MRVTNEMTLQGELDDGRKLTPIRLKIIPAMFLGNVLSALIEPILPADGSLTSGVFCVCGRFEFG
jgi:hypothetical protein